MLQHARTHSGARAPNAPLTNAPPAPLAAPLSSPLQDYGYPQSTSTETLKMYVHNEPVAVDSVRAGGGGGMLASKKTISSSAVQKPISLGGGGGAGKNEIFVDILERLTVLFNSNGYVLNSSVDGCIQMKSYLSGNPGLRIALNEDLIVGKENASGYGGLVLDDCNFHECVNVDDFDSGRTLALIPPDGEFTVMNYRVTSELRAPFRVFPTLEETSQFKVRVWVGWDVGVVLYGLCGGGWMGEVFRGGMQ